MEKTILLGVNDRFSPKTTKWLYLLIGACFLANGLINFYSPNTSGHLGFDLFIMPVMLLAAFCYFFMFAAGFNKHSKFAPRVRITEKIIQFKRSVFTSPYEIIWQDVTAIEFQSYKIIFSGANSSYSVRYETTPEISLEIKRAIRAAAESKGIPVNGG